MPGGLAVTGANGFVGRHLIAVAAPRGWRIVGIVRSAEGARAVQEAGGRPLIVGGLAGESLARAFAGAAAVVHLAQVGSEELDCLLCDEVAESGPLERLLGRRLTPLDQALAAAVRGAPA